MTTTAPEPAAAGPAMSIFHGGDDPVVRAMYQVPMAAMMTPQITLGVRTIHDTANKVSTWRKNETFVMFLQQVRYWNDRLIRQETERIERAEPRIKTLYYEFLTTLLRKVTGNMRIQYTDLRGSYYMKLHDYIHHVYIDVADRLVDAKGNMTHLPDYVRQAVESMMMRVLAIDKLAKIMKQFGAPAAAAAAAAATGTTAPNATTPVEDMEDSVLNMTTMNAPEEPSAPSDDEPEESERSQRTERTERSRREPTESERTERSQRTERSERTERSRREPSESERTERSQRTERSERTERSQRTERTERSRREPTESERTERTERSQRTETRREPTESERTERTERSQRTETRREPTESERSQRTERTETRREPSVSERSHREPSEFYYNRTRPVPQRRDFGGATATLLAMASRPASNGGGGNSSSRMDRMALQELSHALMDDFKRHNNTEGDDVSHLSDARSLMTPRPQPQPQPQPKTEGKIKIRI